MDPIGSDLRLEKGADHDTDPGTEDGEVAADTSAPKQTGKGKWGTAMENIDFWHFACEVNVKVFEHLLDKEVQEAIDDAPTEKVKAIMLLRYLRRSSEGAIYKFSRLIAGIHPSIFANIMGREPTPVESDRSIAALMEKMISDQSGIDHEPLVKEPYIQTRMIKGDSTRKLFVRDIIEKHFKCENYLIRVSESEGLVDVKINDIPPPGSKGSLSLLYGRAGVGKTMLARWALNQWTKMNWATEYTAVFSLDMDDLADRKTAVTLSELLSEHSVHKVHGYYPQIDTWMKNNGSKILIWLDSRNGFSPNHITNKEEDLSSAHPLDLCLRILHGDILQDSCKILTSRPVSNLTDLKADQVVEIVGFTKEGVEDFVHQNVPEEKRDHVQQTLRNVPELLSMCAIPFYCSKVCEMIQEAKPHTILEEEKQTYTRMVSYLLCQFFEFLPQTEDLTIEESMVILRKMVQSIGKNTESPKVTFDETDLENSMITTTEKKLVEDSGLIMSKGTPDALHKDACSTEFHHILLQEILAAAKLHLVGKTATEAFSTLSVSAQKFFVGLAMDSNNICITQLKLQLGCDHDDLARRAVGEDIKEYFRKKLVDASQESPVSVERIQLEAINVAYEAQTSDLASEIAKEVIKEESLRFHNTELSGTDTIGLTYVMKHKMNNLTSLELTKATINDFKLDLLVPLLSESPAIKDLNLSENQITKVGLQKLGGIPRVKEQYSSIVLDHNEGGDEGFRAMSDVLCKSTSLENFSIAHNHITAAGFTNMPEMEKESQLKHLCLSSNDIKDDGMRELTGFLRRLKSLETLQLNENQITDDSIISCTNIVAESPNLKVLHISGNNFTSEGGTILESVRETNLSIRGIWWKSEQHDLFTEGPSGKLDDGDPDSSLTPTVGPQGTDEKSPEERSDGGRHRYFNERGVMLRRFVYSSELLPEEYLPEFVDVFKSHGSLQYLVLTGELLRSCDLDDLIDFIHSRQSIQGLEFWPHDPYFSATDSCGETFYTVKTECGERKHVQISEKEAQALPKLEPLISLNRIDIDFILKDNGGEAELRYSGTRQSITMEIQTLIKEHCSLNILCLGTYLRHNDRKPLIQLIQKGNTLKDIRYIKTGSSSIDYFDVIKRGHMEHMRYYNRVVDGQRKLLLPSECLQHKLKRYLEENAIPTAIDVKDKKLVLFLPKEHEPHKKALSELLEDTDTIFKDEMKIHIIEEDMIKIVDEAGTYEYGPGEKIYYYTQDGQSHVSTCGTFIQNKDGKLYILTSCHGNTPTQFYLEEASKKYKLDCAKFVFSKAPLLDAFLLEVSDKDLLDRCKPGKNVFQNDVLCGSYRGLTEDIAGSSTEGLPVMTYKEATKRTTGLLTHYGFQHPSQGIADGLIIRPMGPGKPFSEKGDCGSVIVREAVHDHRDKERHGNLHEGLAMLCYGVEGLVKDEKCSLAFRLDEAIRHLAEENGTEFFLLPYDH